jgi:hypothetical protein
MGISASQARLLTITARLTSNEYESQQISNAKMRLAIKSEQASSEYIAALNKKQFMFTTYDAKGNATTAQLTANVLYQYADMKNQYALINSSGQMLVASADAKNFKLAENLDEFLKLNGIDKEYKSNTLSECAKRLNAPSAEGGLKNYYTDWEQAVENAKIATYTDESGKEISSDERFRNDKYNNFQAYNIALRDYEEKVALYNSGLTSTDIKGALATLNSAKEAYSHCVNFDEWAKFQVKNQKPEIYENVTEYYRVLDDFLSEAEDLGCTSLQDTYTYSDATKAQWYTNLWYRMNGASSEKSAQGNNETNFAILDSKLASSKDWLQDALGQGLISLEVASNALATNLIPDESKPLNVILKGISWTPTEYGSCKDFTELDDDKAIARAEAEYQRKNNEISSIDKKYENKIKTLDTEHNSLQTEYESVQSAMNKNVERSFKTFS